eukprot:NODE_95_length_21511_cov_0.501168.p22 type:complete len:107 gc:universal NODE_95_length_21511_cov_0.501168:4130-4450(+)
MLYALFAFSEIHLGVANLFLYQECRLYFKNGIKILTILPFIMYLVFLGNGTPCTSLSFQIASFQRAPRIFRMFILTKSRNSWTSKTLRLKLFLTLFPIFHNASFCY